MLKESIQIDKDGIPGLSKVLEDYQGGTVGGHLEDQLDKAVDTIEAIKGYLRGDAIEIIRQSYPPFSVYRLYRLIK